MNRRATRGTRSASTEVAANAPKDRPLQNTENQRPAVPNALSKAYGAPGRVKFPAKQAPRPDGAMVTIMQDLVEAPEQTDSEQDEQPSEADQEEVESNLVKARQTQDTRKGRTIEKRHTSTARNNRRRAASHSEGDELEDENQQSSNAQNGLSNGGYAGSPFAAVARKVRNMWSGAEPNSQGSFIAEDKIAAEARIARPRKSLARRLLDLKEKVIGVWEDSTGSFFVRTLIFVIKVFTGVLVLLLALQAASSMLPDLSITENLETFSHKFISPIHSIWDELTSKTRQGPDIVKEIDLTQLKALKDSTSAQFKHIKSRLDSIEATYSRLAKKSNTPTPERKVNLFASGTGLTIDPYLTSPTRALNIQRKNLLTRSYARWRGWPESIQHGPISAFTPWEDMGDCWCTPGSGGRAQIVVGLAQPVIPQELIIEHMPKKATLQAGSAPKGIELWAQVRDPKKRDALTKASLQYGIYQDVDKNGDDHLKSLDHTWIKVGQWMYDIHGSSHVQTFDIQLPLEELDIPISRFAFRASSNWGPVDHVCIYRLKLHGLVTTSSPTHINGLGY